MGVRTATVASGGKATTPTPGAAWVLPWLIGALALVPALSMLALVQAGNHMQWNDYWDILARVTHPDGSFAPGGLFTYQNEHPVAIPGLVYWLNAHLAGGSNIALGTFVVLVVVVQVLLLAWKLPRQVADVSWLRALFVVALSTMLFARRGAHNFYLAMSGTAWLTANLFAIVAIVVAWRRWPWVSLVAAALASLSYGTGLVVWPVLILVAVLEGRSWRWTAALAGTTAVAVALYAAGYESPRGMGGSDRTFLGVGRRTLQVLGGPFSEDPSVALRMGGLALGAAVALVVLARWRGLLSELSPWIGLLTYAVGGAVLIGIARGGLRGEIALTSRYVSLGALFWLAVLVLAAALVPLRSALATGIAVVCVAVFAAGRQSVRETRATRAFSDEAAIALRLGSSPDRSDWRFNVRVVPRLWALDHYPFSDSFSELDCGLLGRRLDVPTAVGRTSWPRLAVTGAIHAVEPAAYDGTVRVRGWVDDSAQPGDCILIVNDVGTVVGVATRDEARESGRALGLSRPDRFTGIARNHPGWTYRAVVADRAGPLVAVLDSDDRSYAAL